MTSRQILLKARNLIARGWTQGALARNDEGEVVHPRSAEAVAWSVTGAIHAGDRYDTDEVYRAFAVVQRVVGDANEHRWNNEPGRTQEEVLDAVDEAIKRLPAARQKFKRIITHQVLHEDGTPSVVEDAYGNFVEIWRTNCQYRGRPLFVFRMTDDPLRRGYISADTGDCPVSDQEHTLAGFGRGEEFATHTDAMRALADH